MFPPIDIVYAWCGEKCLPSIDDPRRHRDCMELRYSLRSVHKYVPWINHIYILVNTEDMTLPSWLNEESRKWITFVDRCELLDTKAPTYNSFAVHTVIHKIPQLTNHFIVMDDDMFFNNPVSPAYFFDETTMKPICRIKREPKKIYETIIHPEYPTYKYSTISHQPLSFRIDYIHLFEEKYPTYHAFIQSHTYRYKVLSEYLFFIYYEFALDLILIDTSRKSFLQIPHVHEIDILPQFQQIYKILNTHPNFVVFNCNDDFSLDPTHFSKQLSVLKIFYEKLYPEVPYFEHDHFFSTKKIVIAGCGQNIQPYIQQVFKNIYTISALFADYKIIIFENDSTDQTLEILNSYAKKDSNITLLSERNIPVPRYLHPCRIAYCRNRLLEKINASFMDYDFMVMVDLDDVCATPIQIHHFKNIFKNKAWDSVSFNREHYYDKWALRYPRFVKNCWNFASRAECVHYITQLGHHIVHLLKNNDMVPVFSAFNGFAIYKMDKIKHCKYDGRNKERRLGNRARHWEDCEHVAFHCDMIKKNGARHFISSAILFSRSVDTSIWNMPENVPHTTMSNIITK